MKLDFIDLGKLSISKTNMRYAKKGPTLLIFCWTCNGFVPVTYLIMPPWPQRRVG